MREVVKVVHLAETCEYVAGSSLDELSLHPRLLDFRANRNCFGNVVIITASAFKWHKQTLSVGVTLIAEIDPEDYVAAT